MAVGFAACLKKLASIYYSFRPLLSMWRRWNVDFRYYRCLQSVRPRREPDLQSSQASYRAAEMNEICPVLTPYEPSAARAGPGNSLMELQESVYSASQLTSLNPYECEEYGRSINSVDYG